MTELRIIDGGGEDAGPPVCTSGPVSRRSCGHLRVELDAAERKVYCAECGAVRDPFDALMTLAERLDHYKGWGERYKGEARRAEEELKDLKRQVRNARAQLKRWRAKP